MYSCKDKIEQANQLDTTCGCECLDKMEEALQQVTEQTAVRGRQQRVAPSYKRPRGPVECYRCDGGEHIARNCWRQENYQGSTSPR